MIHLFKNDYILLILYQMRNLLNYVVAKNDPCIGFLSVNMRTLGYIDTYYVRGSKYVTHKYGTKNKHYNVNVLGGVISNISICLRGIYLCYRKYNIRSDILFMEEIGSARHIVANLTPNKIDQS
jgi:hypothetical protein